MSTKQWLAFHEVRDTGKTKVWEIHNVENGSFLGRVKWNGGWRQYVFETERNCFWNAACLAELSEFIRSQMDARKAVHV